MEDDRGLRRNDPTTPENESYGKRDEIGDYSAGGGGGALKVAVAFLSITTVGLIGAVIGVAVWGASRPAGCEPKLPDKPIGLWTQIVPAISPPPRLAHSALSVDNKYMYIHGGMFGFTNTTLDDLWRYTEETDTWVQITTTGDIPPARYHHTMVNADNKKLIVFGGFNVFNTVPGHDSFSDLYSLDLATLVWTRLDTSIGSTKPSKRGAHDAVFYNGEMYLFGGFASIGATGHESEFWKYNVAGNTWTDLTPASPTATISALTYPHGRIGFAWAVVGNKAFMYGGGCEDATHTEDTGQCGDMWEYNFVLGTWTHKTPKGRIPANRRAAHGDDNLHGILYLYGGVHINTTSPPPKITMYDDLHAYDPEQDQWFELHPNWDRPPKPPGTFGHSIVAVNEKVIIFGGRVSAPTSPGTNQLWEYHTIQPKDRS